MRNIVIGSLILLAGSSANLWAQGDEDDPMVTALSRLVQEMGGQRKLSRDPAFQQSFARWAEYERAISKAVKEQDAAMDGSKDHLDRVKMQYAAAAQSRGQVVDDYLYGRIMGLTGEIEIAYEYFKRALAADKFFFWAWDGLGVYHVNKKNWQASAVHFERALQINERFSKAAFGLAQCHLETRNYNAAALRLNELIQTEGALADFKSQTQARLLLAEVYRNQQDFKRCIDELTWLVDQGAKDFRVYALRAQCHKNLERWKEAAKDYEAIIELDPKEFRFYFFLATCHEHLGSNKAAIAAYEDGLEAGKIEIGPDTVSQVRAQIERLRKRPATENPEKRKLSPEDRINQLRFATDPAKRREAIMWLSRLPIRINQQGFLQQFLVALSRGLQDTDSIVQAKCLEQLCLRFNGLSEVFELTKLLTRKRYDPKVRGMACHMLRTWDDEKVVIPCLVRALRDEVDGYVVHRIHDTLNTVTLAWIERVLPDDLNNADIARVRRQWKDWYASNRDIYRKHEPKGFDLQESSRK